MRTAPRATNDTVTYTYQLTIYSINQGRIQKLVSVGSKNKCVIYTIKKKTSENSIYKKLLHPFIFNLIYYTQLTFMT